MSYTDELKSLVAEYLKYEPHVPFRKQIEELVEAKKYDELSKEMLPRIAFGTAGLRAKMGGGYHNINDLVIIQTTQAMCKYFKQQFPDDYATRGIALGFDGRHNSERFATIAATIILSHGFNLFFFPRIVATPFVPFTIRTKKCCGGVVVTASHNPKEDNGYKLFYQNSAQIVPPHDKNIQALIMQSLVPELKSYDLDKTNPLYHDVMDDMLALYYQTSVDKTLFTVNENKDTPLTVTYTAMHGVGAPFVRDVFKAANLPAYIPTVQQIQVDPEFSTVKFPNPEEGAGALKLAIATAEAAKSPLILANDPDADRLAVAEWDEKKKEWYIFNGNEIAMLFSSWVWRQYIAKHPEIDKKQCIMLASTVSSKLLQSMAKKEGFTFKDTLTGFKWMGSEGCRYQEEQGMTFLFAYEVEIGFLAFDLSFDKDGVRMAAMFYELASDLYKQGKTCQEQLEVIYQKYGYHEMTTSYYFCDDVKTIEAVFTGLRNWHDKGGYPLKMGEFPIACVRDCQLGYDSSREHNKSVLPTTKANMMTFYLENGTVATLRPSGTEPKLKYYIESQSTASKADARAVCDAVTKALVDHFIQPKKLGLKGKGEI